MSNKSQESGQDIIDLVIRIIFYTIIFNRQIEREACRVPTRILEQEITVGYDSNMNDTEI